MDMHSGGGQKLDFSILYIEAPEDEAIGVFYNRFGRNPHRVTCTCCGPDYSVREVDDEPSEFADAYGTVAVIEAKDIEPYERNMEPPRQGYVWVG